MRNNPTNPSAGEAFDKLSRIEKLDAESIAQPPPLPRLIPRSPTSPLKASPDSLVLARSPSALDPANRESSLSYVLPGPSPGYTQAGLFPGGANAQVERSNITIGAPQLSLPPPDVHYAL